MVVHYVVKEHCPKNFVKKFEPWKDQIIEQHSIHSIQVIFLKNYLNPIRFYYLIHVCTNPT
jgi:hypothetical protein